MCVVRRNWEERRHHKTFGHKLHLHLSKMRLVSVLLHLTACLKICERLSTNIFKILLCMPLHVLWNFSIFSFINPTFAEALRNILCVLQTTLNRDKHNSRGPHRLSWTTQTNRYFIGTKWQSGIYVKWKKSIKSSKNILSQWNWLFYIQTEYAVKLWQQYCNIYYCNTIKHPKHIFYCKWLYFFYLDPFLI